MKKIICITLLLCLVCSVAVADIVEDFNVMIGVFGCKLLLPSQKTEKNGFVIYDADECIVTFKGQDRIYVEGKGELFVPYCMAAIMAFETDASTFRDNCGRFLPYYLLARDGTEQSSTTSSGYLFLIQKSDKGLVFTIGK